MFFGGWDIPFTQWDNEAPFTVLKTLATTLMMISKVGFFIFVFMWIRWTLPRFRYDQLMHLGWKSLIPLAILNMVITAAVVIARNNGF
jgi:NADH-quinone oxidoreductase subunit H